ncbi:MAG: riboflavin kinase [Clostridia bacterium]|nr:riboflavin kinase [Clostridia bacterium]
MRSAADCLGRLYSFSLPVLHGKELGRTIGVPTANQIFFSGMQIPGVGTYASTVRLGDTLYPGVTNIGYRPSVEDGSAPLLNAETHIIGYEGDLYGKELRVGIRFRLRNETKFPSLDALADQIRVDISRSLEDFQKEGGWGLCI